MAGQERVVDKIIFGCIEALPDPMAALIRPLGLLYLSLSFLPYVLYNIATGQTPMSVLSSWPAFKDAWFARFWTYFGPLSLRRAAPGVTQLLLHASGVVLDIGSGQGHFLSLYDASPSSKITKIYSVEPNRDHHQALRANAKAAGFGDKFEILDARIEELESRAGIRRASVDTIVTLQTLCSVSGTEVLIPELRTYLKPGGKWIVSEHVKRHDHGPVSRYQQRLNVIWRQCFNGCELTRDTQALIEGTGRWVRDTQGRTGLKSSPNDSPWTILPTVEGVLVSQ